MTRTVVLRLRFHDFEKATRSRSLTDPTDSTETILAVARGLLEEAMPLIRDRGCTLIGLSLTNMSSHGAVQLAFDFGTADRAEAHAAELDVAVDALRGRFGRDAITRGTLVHRQHGDDAPMLPD